MSELQAVCYAPRGATSVARGLHEMNTPVITVLVDRLLRLRMACHVGRYYSRPPDGHGVSCVSRFYPLPRRFEFPSLTRTVLRMAAPLIVSLAVAVLVGHQFHTAAHDPMHASPGVHPGACSFHTTSHLCSLLAILPRGLASARVVLFTLYALAVGFSLQGFSFPLFIPPRAILHVQSA